MEEMVLTVVNKPRIISAATMCGYLVRNPENEDLGCIEELMIDPEAGRIAYAVLSLGGILGRGGKLYAVPWMALRLNADQRVFVLEADLRTLETAPAFDEENWPDFSDGEWERRVHDHFGRQPVFEAA